LFSAGLPSSRSLIYNLSLSSSAASITVSARDAMQIVRSFSDIYIYIYIYIYIFPNYVLDMTPHGRVSQNDRGQR